ncbi:MAG: (Fe-S)-binding protein [Candidatus Syntropharchaeia archaeon]
MPNPMEIYKFLPKTNCKECGESTCMAFAVKLLSAQVKIEDCTQLSEEDIEKIRKIVSPPEGVEESGLVIHEEKCYGCGNCVVACPVNVANDPEGAAIGIPKGDKLILKVIDGVVRSFNISECRRLGEEKILCNACIATCPSKAIEFVGG